MVLDPSEQWSALMFQIMGKEKALRYLRELAKQNILLRRESSSMRAQLIAAGEAPMDIDSTLGPVEELKKRRAPIDWITLGPVPVVTSAHAIAVRPLHPNAAKLYLDFVLSKEGQRTVLNFGRQVARTDLRRTGNHQESGASAARSAGRRNHGLPRKPGARNLPAVNAEGGGVFTTKARSSRS